MKTYITRTGKTQYMPTVDEWVYRTNLRTTEPSVHHRLIRAHFGLALARVTAG